MNKHILFFGFGYCAQFLAPLLAAQGWHISATCRDADKAARLQGLGINALMLDGAPLSVAALDGVSHIVLSAAPSDDGDPALPLLRPALERWLIIRRNFNGSAICRPPAFMATMRARGLMKIRHRGHWARAAKDGSRPKRLGGNWPRRMVCRCIIFASPAFTGPGAINWRH